VEVLCHIVGSYICDKMVLVTANQCVTGLAYQLFLYTRMYGLILTRDLGEKVRQFVPYSSLESKTACPLQDNYYIFNFTGLWLGWSDPNLRAVLGMGMRSLDCWDCGFESRWRHRCLSLVRVVYCLVRSVRRSDHSSRGVLLTVVCLGEDSSSSWPTIVMPPRIGLI
jgi:hypothetical protein